ncbi:MAG: recombination protein RecR [Kiritimatiellae bacterium]|nr:recombination protein RecR [Kiritimatiellia bacterium]
MTAHEPLENLIKTLARLPAIGRRSAERMAMRLVQGRGNLVDDLIAALQDMKASVRCCSKCGSVTTTREDPCRLCTDPRRDDHILCVVENPGDITLIERSGAFRGRYHALMGRISPMEGEGVDNIRVSDLVKRIKAEGVTEVIFALNSDVESDATASFLHDLLVPKGVKVTRIAFGLPAGSGIAYSDPVTLSRAMEGRREL